MNAYTTNIACNCIIQRWRNKRNEHNECLLKELFISVYVKYSNHDVAKISTISFGFKMFQMIEITLLLLLLLLCYIILIA